MPIRLQRKLETIEDLIDIEACLRAMYNTVAGTACQALLTMEYVCWRNRVIGLLRKGGGIPSQAPHPDSGQLPDSQHGGGEGNHWRRSCVGSGSCMPGTRALYTSCCPRSAMDAMDAMDAQGHSSCSRVPRNESTQRQRSNPPNTAWTRDKKKATMYLRSTDYVFLHPEHDNRVS